MGKRLPLFLCCLIAIIAKAEVNQNAVASIQIQTQTIPWYLSMPQDGGFTIAAINALDLITSTDKKQVVVAVIDSGVYAEHPALQGKLYPGVDIVSNISNSFEQRGPDSSPDAQDEVCPATGRVATPKVLSHGTQITSVIVGNAWQGMFGVNPAVRAVPVKVTGACPANRLDLIDGIAWAAGFSGPGVEKNKHPAKVINLSISGGDTVCNSALQEMINKVVSQGVILVSAAGNTFGGPAREPAICAGVISVGSVNPDKSKAYYTAIDSRVTVYAPGGGKDFSQKNVNYKNRIRVASYEEINSKERIPVVVDTGMGTSYSSALVTGVVAALASENPQINALEVTRLLRQPDANGDCCYLDYEQLKKGLRKNITSN